MTDAPKKYFIRFAQASDFDNITAFYDVNEHKNVFKRKAELIRHFSEIGGIVLAEDEAGKIVAASINYPHEVEDSDGVKHVEWQEIGTTRCVLGGFRIVDAMVSMQILRAFLVEPPESTFVMRTMTTQVQGLAASLGWRRMEGGPSPKLLKAMAETISDTDHPAETNWFVCGVEAIPVLAKRIKDVIDNPIFKNAKTGEEIEIDLSKSGFFTMFKDEISRLAGQDFGDVDKPDQQQSLRQCRDKWLKDFFR